MKIHPYFITESGEGILLDHIDTVLNVVHEKKRDGRNRIIRYGWDYENPMKWIRDIPSWLFAPSWPGAACVLGLPILDGLVNSVTINEYLRGQIIAPHIDSHAFGDVAILSLLSDATMRFVSPTGQVKDFELPRRSLAVMAGELRNSWQHSTLPLEADRRISVVYRTKL